MILGDKESWPSQVGLQPKGKAAQGATWQGREKWNKSQAFPLAYCSRMCLDYSTCVNRLNGALNCHGCAAPSDNLPPLYYVHGMTRWRTEVKPQDSREQARKSQIQRRSQDLSKPSVKKTAIMTAANPMAELPERDHKNKIRMFAPCIIPFYDV